MRNDWLMVAVPQPTPRDRLFRVALRLGGVRDTWVKDAVEIASALVAAGDAGTATLAVACLAPGVIQSDAEPLIRDMLDEQSVPFPEGEAEDERLTRLLAAFAHGVVHVGEFLGEFYSQLPDWDSQDALQRDLVVALDRWETESDMAERQRLAEDMRQIIRERQPDC
jgi:hypothetical protein